MKYKFSKVTLAVLLILTALIALMSAYGAMCPAWHPERILLVEEGEILELSSYKMHKVITTFLTAYRVANILTWVAAGLCVVCVVALFARLKVFYHLTLFTVVLGAVSGFIPWFLLKINGGSTPSYMRTILYAIVLVLLVIPPIYRPFLPKNIKETRKVKGSAVPALAAGLFFPGVLLAIQAVIVGPSHMMAAADLFMAYGMIEAIQIGLGVLLVAASILVFAITQLRKRK